MTAQSPEVSPPGPQESPLEPESLLTPAEAAEKWRVDVKTLTRWASAGKLRAIRTPGGHRRYREAELKLPAGRLLSPAEAAVMSGITAGHLGKLAAKEELPFCRTPGGDRRYLEEDIRALLAGQPAETEGEA